MATLTKGELIEQIANLEQQLKTSEQQLQESYDNVSGY